jgi:hypothetical protein
MLERPVAVLCASVGIRSAVVLALMAIIRPWEYSHVMLPIIHVRIQCSRQLPASDCPESALQFNRD